jgi:hypothetical protein
VDGPRDEPHLSAHQRLAGERIGDRIVPLADSEATPIRKGKLGRPNEFGYVAQMLG